MKYPYYIIPAVEEYRQHSPTSEEGKRLSRIIAANIGDYASLRLVLGIDPPEFGCFYPDMEMSRPTTLDTIDNFLDKFGTKAAGGYFHTEEIEGIPVEATQSAPDKTEETLKSLIGQGKYDEAIVLIEGQNLNNPKKSIYFAHQIRFLKKLKAIQKYRNNNQG